MSLIATDKYSTVEGDRNDLAKSKTNLGDQWLKEAKLQWTAEIVCEFMFGVSYVVWIIKRLILSLRVLSKELF